MVMAIILTVKLHPWIEVLDYLRLLKMQCFYKRNSRASTSGQSVFSSIPDLMSPFTRDGTAFVGLLAPSRHPGYSQR